MPEILYAILALLVILIIVLLIRTLTFKDKTNFKTQGQEIEWEKDDIVYKLGQLIKIPTISYEDRLKKSKNYTLMYLNIVNSNKLKIWL